MHYISVIETGGQEMDALLDRLNNDGEVTFYFCGDTFHICSAAYGTGYDYSYGGVVIATYADLADLVLGVSTDVDIAQITVE